MTPAPVVLRAPTGLPSPRREPRAGAADRRPRPVAPRAPAAAPREDGAPAFAVRLANFTGPFDLLLSLIAAHQLDVTEVALAQVTDDFLAHVRGLPSSGAQLGESSEFLVVAATLLDLKAARLLPAGEVEDAEDVARLEERDLLFARLLQYRAYRRAADDLAERFAAAALSLPRAARLEPHLAAALPELVLALTPAELALMAARALAPRPAEAAPAVTTAHLHVAPVDVAEEAERLATRLEALGAAAFTALVADAGSTAAVVARFLALLELHRAGRVRLEQADPGDPLLARWAGGPSPSSSPA